MRVDVDVEESLLRVDEDRVVEPEPESELLLERMVEGRVDGCGRVVDVDEEPVAVDVRLVLLSVFTELSVDVAELLVLLLVLPTVELLRSLLSDDEVAWRVLEPVEVRLLLSGVTVDLPVDDLLLLSDDVPEREVDLTVFVVLLLLLLPEGAAVRDDEVFDDEL